SRPPAGPPRSPLRPLTAFLTRRSVRAGLLTPSKTVRRHLAAHTKEEHPMTTPFTHENVIKLAGVLGVAPELRLTANGNSVATLIVYTNYILRNDDGSTR